MEEKKMKRINILQPQGQGKTERDEKNANVVATRAMKEI